MSIGEEVLFRMTLRAESTCPFQNSIPRTRNEKLLLKSSYEARNPACEAGFWREAKRFKNGGF
jgi:hypothetical protein